MKFISASPGILLACVTISLGQIVGQYPPIFDVSMFRPVVSTSECGIPNVQTYCVYSSNAAASLAPNCNSAVCNGTCPFASSSPTPFNITAAGILGSGVAAVPGRQGSSTTAFSFAASNITVPSNVAPHISSNGFSFTAWILQSDGNTGVLIYKPAANYGIVANKSSIVLYYLSSYSAGPVGILSLTPGYWHHIAVTAYQQDISFYVNGTFVYAVGLGSTIADRNGDILIGQGYGALSSFSGLMQDMYFYSQALPQREVVEVVTGTLPYLHLSTNCRCPPSQPADSPTTEGICIQNPGTGMPNRGSVSRINSLAHPAGYINDLTTSDSWISSIGKPALKITAHLTISLYEIVFVNIVYGTPRPRAAIIETSRDGGITFNPVQFYADDCMSYFGLPNNGPIVAADSVNCITTESLQSPTYGVTVRLMMVNPNVRMFSLDTSPALRTFIQASDLRINMVDFFNTSTFPQHLYYNIQEVTVAGRCACNGHASSCGTDITSLCQCIHNTTGNNCEKCLPLYNDKPWYYGTTTNGYPCKPCTCNNHATSCHYNASLDSFPTSYDLGSGGVCDNCDSYTAGRYCDTCIFGYYQPVNATPTDTMPCVPCSCVLAGVTDNGDCVKSQAVAGAIVGQCSCKTNVVGPTCGTCDVGFYGLNASNPNGCNPCMCNISGAQTLTCDPATGYCTCKSNVGGQNCDECLPGTAWLNASNPNGCTSCGCDPTGSISTTSCNPVTGQCACKPGVGGPRCNQCLPGYFGFSASGCQLCACSLQGSVSTQCDSVTGICPCKANIGGLTCSACTSGFYNFPTCSPCLCNTVGVNQSVTCDQVSGQCTCKSAVTGRACDTCPAGYTGPTSADPSGCYPCSCFAPNLNTSRPACDPATSQCSCLSWATGLSCNACVSGYYQTPAGCVPCACNAQGSVSNACNATTGACSCINAGLAGTNCSQCLSGYWGFPSCRPCGCHKAGSLSGVCNITSGVCLCKRYVTGQNCSVCIAGFQLFDANNPFGCTAAPDQQAPAYLTPLSSTAIELNWLPPEAPNGVILYYIVYRNGIQAANTSLLAYNDTGLLPYTAYTYAIQAVNVVGQNTSYPVSTTTLPGIPQGLATPNVTVLNATSVFASWTPPLQPNGVVSHYVLVLGGGGGPSITVFSGIALSNTIYGLQPFTAYTLLVQACTSGGCGQSNSSSFQTLQATPTSQAAPSVTALNATAVRVDWTAPSNPNGLLIQYDVRERGAPFSGNGALVQSVGAAVFSLVVGGLAPFTTYQFAVVSYTVVGGAQSDWTPGTTNQAAPSGVPSPQLLALSSSSVNVMWFNPSVPNGIITAYNVYAVSVLGNVLLTTSSVPGSYVVQNLQPSTQYSFVEEACTTAGCQTGGVANVTTLDSAPVGQAPPLILNTTSSSVSLQWNAPLQPNGVIAAYTLHRRVPSLQSQSRDVGTSFDGTGLATFSGQVFLGGFINQATVQFRTYNPSGTLFYQINSVTTDFLGVELRGGLPWLIFDVGSGPAVVGPNTTRTFNDGQWHTVAVSQVGQQGTIVVDGLYTGVGQFRGTYRVLGSATIFYVGGIPSAVPHTSIIGGTYPNAVLSGYSFSGCMFNVTLNGNGLSFSTQTDPHPGVGLPQHGCPAGLVRGVAFLGDGYLAPVLSNQWGTYLEVELNIRTTDSRGLLLAMLGVGDFLSVELQNSSVVLSVYVGASVVQSPPVGSNLCDGQWHVVLLEQASDTFYVTVDTLHTAAITAVTVPLLTMEVYFGGFPSTSSGYGWVQGLGVDIVTPYSGCLIPSVSLNGTSVQLEVAASQFVRFDGCSGDPVQPANACNSPVTSVPAFLQTSLTDYGLNPFTEYLYSVTSLNSASSADSSWSLTVTQEGAPSDVSSPLVVMATSSSITVTWQSPSQTNGLVTFYSVVATPNSTVGLSSPAGGAQTTIFNVQTPQMTLQAVVTGLQPATTYLVSVAASTVGGQGMGPPAAISTLESVPIGVQSPVVVSEGTHFLHLEWLPPAQPNGVITLYNLYVGGVLSFSGLNTSVTVSGLLPFHQYTLSLQACTAVGCTYSPSVTNQTLPDSPQGLAPPTLIALGPTSVAATWQPPVIPNGAILGYTLLQLSGAGLAQATAVYSGANLQATVTGLSPATLYFFRLVAYNAGGSTQSNASSVVTIESSPDGVPSPNVTVVNATALAIVWSTPLVPNGVVTGYVLVQNSTNITNGFFFAYVSTNLQPFTAYSYSILACTVRGCGSSTPTLAVTAEAPPVGYMAPNVSGVNSTAFTLVVNPVAVPNGVVSYIVNVSGLFASAGGQLPGTMATRMVYNGTGSGTALVVSGLLPYTQYQVWLEAANSAGSLRGPPITVQTGIGAPQGQGPPSLSLSGPTSLLVQWSPPSLPGAPLLSYMVMLTSATDSHPVDVGQNTSAIVGDLLPYTQYNVYVTASNVAGSTTGPLVNITTGEAAPDGFDAVSVQAVGSSYITVSWDLPAHSNGVLVNFSVYCNGALAGVLPPTVFSYNTTDLLPFTSYVFSATVCTSAGCATSANKSVMTAEGVPSGMGPPLVMYTSGDIAGNIVVLWGSPQTPNGIILVFTVQRSSGDGNYSAVATVAAAAFPSYLDSQIMPFTNYCYRIVAANSVGSTTGPPQCLLTPQAAPQGLQPLNLSNPTSTTIQVYFSAPLVSNGIVWLYQLTRSGQDGAVVSTSLNVSSLPLQGGQYTYTVTGLAPYTIYTFSLTVCTGGGCSATPTASLQTLEDSPLGLAQPVAISTGPDAANVTWTKPAQPNGPLRSYELLRYSLGFQNASNSLLPTCCDEYVGGENLSSGCSIVAQLPPTAVGYGDQTLYPYTYYQYCLVAANDAGTVASGLSGAILTQPAPMPLSGPVLNCTAVNSTTIAATWNVPNVSQLLGPLQEYVLFERTLSQPWPGSVIFRGLAQSFVVTGLNPSTSYFFTISVSNGVGVTFGSNASATTAEGVPANLSAPAVTPISGTSLSVTWTAPAQPNGFIVNYTIYINNAVNQVLVAPGTAVVTDLRPYSQYSVRVGACTLFGCTTSPGVLVTTLQSPPDGIATPIVTVTGSTSVVVTWSPPQQPNGIILGYQLFQRTEVGSCTPPCYTQDEVYNGLGYQYNATGLAPFTAYGYEVVPYNSVGDVSSGFTTVTTLSAAPGGFGPPTVLPLSSSNMSVTWAPPAQLNGVLLPYQLYRNNTLLGNTTSLSYVDSQLSPYTAYAYVVQACTDAGCTSSTAVVNTTLESLPQGVPSPNISNLLATSFLITWTRPAAPNGIILRYVLTLTTNGTVLFNGIGFSLQLNGLQPFTNYSFTLAVCNSIGCPQGGTVLVQTPEAPPQNLGAPTARNLSSTSLAISWQPPATPNGIVTSYTLQLENGSTWSTVFQGYALEYTQTGLIPYTNYYYTVVATNGAGSVESPVTLAHTSPDLPSGLVPPVLSIISATSIQAIWTQPAYPNGVVYGYDLYINGIPALLTTLAFQYTATGLLPFTVYTFYVEVCNQVGCSSSISVATATPQAPAQGLSPPFLVPLNATAVMVTWSGPSQPNGIISQYQIRRRLLGVVSSETVQYAGGTTTFSFINIGLQPYTSYQYRLAVINGGGAGYSDWNTTQTFQSAPSGVSTPTIADSNVYARNVTATWAPPSQPNGVIASYLLYYRLFDPLANGFGTSTLAATVPASVTTATVTGLQPATIYEFSVTAVNAGGQTQGGWAMVTMKQDAPEQVSSITIQSQTATSFTLTWFPPTKPNGVITLYTLYINGQISYQGTATTAFVQGFNPFTTYTAILSACTLAGCTNGTAQTITTSEGQPSGQGTPGVNATGPRTVLVMWSPPSQPNGVIVQYQVLRQVLGTPSTLTTVFSTSNTMTLQYTDSTVTPGTQYQYAIGVSNSVAQTVGGFASVTVPEAPPQGVGAPVPVALSSSQVQITWLPPAQPNGVVVGYQLFRSGGGASNVSVYAGLALNATDGGLSPYTSYTYVVQACTLPGCSIGLGTSVLTNEAAPAGVGSPGLLALLATVIGISWSPPTSPNGVIVQYVVSIQPVSILITTTKLAVNVTNLTPYTLFTVTITACTSAGCTAGGPSSVLTLESIPGPMQPPLLSATSPTSILISWKPPSIPNGVIVHYTVMRTGLDGTILFDVGGTNLTYLDSPVLPNHMYTYSMQAYTSVGGGDFGPSQTVTTPSDTPQNISGPTLLVLNASAIFVQWTAPGTPNGIIRNYSLYVNGLDVFNGLGTAYTVTGLAAYSTYTFVLLACTTTCGSSPPSTAVTSEALPSGLAAPQLLGFSNTTVLVTWQPPAQANGVIRSYTVLRSVFGGSVFSAIFVGLSLSYRDADPALVPATRYEYQLMVTNGAGNASSPLAFILLPEAPPQLIPAPVFQNVTSTSLVVVAMPPGLPNGILSLYRLYLNQLLWNSTSSVSSSPVLFPVGPLEPYTSYSFQLEACDSAGCGRGPVSSVTTGEAAPGGLEQPSLLTLADRSVTLRWAPPAYPNGLIQSYSLWYILPCPQPSQPSFLNLPVCSTSSLTFLATVPGTQLTYVFAATNFTSPPLPYTTYQFQLKATNSAGSVVSNYSDYITTSTSAPLALSGNFFVTSISGVVSFDWSSAFQYNGPVQHFSLQRNGTIFTQLQATQYTSLVEPVGPVVYVVTVTTDVGDASTNTYYLIITSPTGSSSGSSQSVTTLSTATSVQQPSTVYSQPAFIIGMVALAVVLVAIIFIFILCCLRPRKDGTNGFGAFKNIGQGLRPVSIESSNRYSQFINQDYVQDHTHLQGHVLVNQGYREDHKQDPVGYMQGHKQDPVGYMQGHTQGHMQGHMQDHDHVRVKQKYMYEFDQDNTGADSTRQSWSPEHGDWELKDTPIELRDSVLLSQSDSSHKDEMLELQDTAIRPLSQQLSESSDASDSSEKYRRLELDPFEPIRDTHITLRHSLSPSTLSEDSKGHQSLVFLDTRV